MIELRKDSLQFSFPDIHPQARLTIEFVRTLRIPDDGNKYPLPAGLGKFPILHVDDYASRLPEEWINHGGVMLPMYQSEALWLNFTSSYITNQGRYPFAVKVLTGKINAISGEEYAPGLHRSPQNYLVSNKQPWLDGYVVGKGVVRQFVAAKLGDGYTAEEQITGMPEHGGLQIVVYPMKREKFEEKFPKRVKRMRMAHRVNMYGAKSAKSAEMGIAPGGMIEQVIHRDSNLLDEWEQEISSRCFVHILNSNHWLHATGHNPPTKPITSKQYKNAGIPWFSYYESEITALTPEPPLEQLLSLATLMKAWKGKTLPDNKTIEPGSVKELGSKGRRKGLKKDQVREGVF